MVVREGLKAMLEADGGIQVVGQAENGREAVELAQKLRPAIILMDIAMPQLNGLEATRQIVKAQPSARVVLLSAHSDPAYVERAVELGAKGYLLKRTSLATLTEVIREVARGGTAFKVSVEKLPERQNVSKGSREKAAALTTREAEVLQLVAEGRTNKQIAESLCLSAKTIEKHRQNLMAKLGIHDTAGLTRYAISKGIIESEIPITLL
jgi:DNA-binding NarL/FixJ family response regulator